MKKVKYLIALVCVSCNMINISSQEIEYDCNINMKNYVFIDSLIQENNLIDLEKANKYLHYPKQHLFITNNDDYQLFKNPDAKDIDFEQYNVFVGFFGRYGSCTSTSIPIKFLLLSDAQSKQYITSIIQYTHIPYRKIGCPIPYCITVVIPKKYCNKICYTHKFIENQKFIENEN